jgi:hypothetical protein
MSEGDDEIREYVQANREFIADTLVNSTRAQART